MTLLACQIFSTIAHEGSFARTAEQLHLTPSAISHAVSTMEAECGFPLFTRTKSGVTMTAAAENLLPAIQRLLASSESLDQSIAQINGMHKGVLRLGVFNSACVTWLPQLVPQFQLDFPGIDVQIYQGSYADICAWVKNGTAEIGFLSNSSALDLDFEPLYDDELVCIAPASYRPARPGCVSAEELRRHHRAAGGQCAEQLDHQHVEGVHQAHARNGGFAHRGDHQGVRQTDGDAEGLLCHQRQEK